MKNTLLLPRICRPIGIILLPFSWINLIAIYRYDYTLPFTYKRIYWKTAEGALANSFVYNFTEQFAWIIVIMSLFMVAFSKLKKEDEYVQSVRLDSILLSIYIYILLFISLIVMYWNSILFILALNIVPLLMLFVLIFNFRLFILPRFTKSKTP